MHAELIVPGLFSETVGARAQSLELLLARGRAASSPAASLEEWLRDSFGLEEQALSAGALTLAATGADPGDEYWARADPVHLRLMRDRLIVVPSAAFSLSREEAEALAEALNRHFAERLLLKVIDAERWCVHLDQRFSLEAGPPLEAAGRDVDLALRIGGEAGKRWAAVANEIQMVLHAHPVNEAREARGEPAVNSLWLWGVGTAPKVPAARWQSVSANDPLPIGLAQLGMTRHRELPAGADEWLARVPQEGRHLVLLDTLRAPLALGNEADYRSRVDALEKDWFAPLLAALREGRVGMLTLHVPDRLGASFEVIRGDLRRFWRRPKALEKYA